MANIYDGAFRTILNDCRKLIIPVIKYRVYISPYISMHPYKTAWNKDLDV